MTDKQLETVVDSSRETGTVSVDVSALSKVSTAKIPAKLVKAVVESNTATGLQVILPTGSVKLDSTAVEAVNGGKDVTISVENVKTADLTATQKETLGDKLDSAIVVDVNVLINGVKQTDFNGGKVTVSMPYTPKEGEDTSKLTIWYIKADGSIENVGGYYDAVSKCFVFTTTHLSRYILVSDTTASVFPFVDVNMGDWFFEDVMFVYDKELMLGTSETTFSPYDTTTRAMVATILWRMEGSPEVTGSSGFTDVESGKYYTKAVTWAKQNNIVMGYSDKTFAPDAPVTREQLAAFFYRYADYKGYDTDITGDIGKFTDKDNISDWAVDAMKWAVGYGLIQGKTGNRLDPQGSATRAELAAMLHRFIGKNELVEGVTMTGFTGWIDPKRLNIPNTGDMTSGAWPFVMFASLAAGAILLIQYKRRNGAHGGAAGY